MLSFILSQIKKHSAAVCIVLVGIIIIQTILLNNYKQRYDETKRNLDKMAEIVEKRSDIPVEAKRQALEKYYKTIPVVLKKNE